jgi:hypothetical protein
MLHQQFFGLIDTVMIQKVGKGIMCRFFEIPAADLSGAAWLQRNVICLS